MPEKRTVRRTITIGALTAGVTLAAVVAFESSPRQPGTVQTTPAPPSRPLLSPVSTSRVEYKCDFNRIGVHIHAQSPQPASVLGEGNPGDGFTNLNSQGVYNYGTDNKTGVTGYVYFSYLDCGLVTPADDATR
jgi:hypothetical protein